MIPISFQDKKIRPKNGHPSHLRFYGPRPITWMERTPVKEREKWSMPSGRDTNTSRVGQLALTDRCKAGDQTFRGSSRFVVVL